MEFPTSFHFAGNYNSSYHYNYGDICIKDGKICCCIRNNHWEFLDWSYEEPQVVIEEEIIYQCRNCGAPTNDKGICPYCGTINRKGR